MFYNANLHKLIRIGQHYTGKFSKTYDYFGYSIASCFDSSDNHTYTFIGAPRANFMKGKVDYFKYMTGALNSYMISGSLAKNNEFGSYFGAALACGYTKKDKIQVTLTRDQHPPRRHTSLYKYFR